MKIERKRFAVVRKNRTEIWCGLARNFYFKEIDDIGDTTIKTYSSRKKAKASCSMYTDDCEIIPIIETLQEVPEDCYQCDVPDEDGWCKYVEEHIDHTTELGERHEKCPLSTI